MKKILMIALMSLPICTRLAAVEPPFPGRWSEPSTAGRKPAMDIKSRYRIVDQSIQNGQFGDIHSTTAYRFGQPFTGIVNGKTYWLVPVRYFKPAPSASIYTQGRIMAEAYACVNDDRVELWIPRYSQRFGL